MFYTQCISDQLTTNILRIANNIQVLRTPEYIYVVFDMFHKAIAITFYKLS